MSGHDERDMRAARMLLASLPNAPADAVQAIAEHIAKLRDRAVDRVCEVHEQADTAHAAGYAEAVADIREMLKGKLVEQETFVGGMALILVDEWLATGAHVGAAKKGGDK